MHRRTLKAAAILAGCIASAATTEPEETVLIVSCTDRVNTGACTQFDLSNAENQEAARSDVEASCNNTADGDGAVFAEGECAAGIASCDGATGTLEESQETVPLKVVWYDEACALGADTATTCSNLGGTFSGTACSPP